MATRAIQSSYALQASTAQNLTISSSSTRSVPLNPQTHVIRVVGTGAFALRRGDTAVVALATDTYFPANTPEYINVRMHGDGSGQSIAIIGVGGSTGNVNIVECTQ